MREIKYRGKRVDNGEWVYGELMGGSIHIQESTQEEWWGYPVIPETVGQFTGLHDKNGKEIYEGDIVHWPHLKASPPYKVFYCEEEVCFYGRILPDGESESYLDSGCVVIGAIHAPELLQERERRVKG